ncbi:uncharacterized protein LOC122543612 [Chiloscyllium plagiosum]|uniref:uncharacterized protein LOC122543612 n=1 Tax=Chiloscyllium plagiosum TaxID=36176 RepID=UPI001CB83C6A|nr:uncharacterized protein LOC122543612 [Chiloscyllium plagiosum]
MGLTERTLCLGALRITSNLACSKGAVCIQSVSGQTIVLLLFTDICVTGFLFLCWFTDLQLTNGQEVISLRFLAFLNETYNAVTFLILALIAAETHFASRLQQVVPVGKHQLSGRPAPARRQLTLVNGVYTLLCWIIATSYGAHYYPDAIRPARRCLGEHPFDGLGCLRGFYLPDPFLALTGLMVTSSYLLCQRMQAESSETLHQVPTPALPSEPPISGEASCHPLKVGHTTPTRRSERGYLLPGLVAALMLYPDLPYLGLTSSFISCFERLSLRFFAHVWKLSRRGPEPVLQQSGLYALIHVLLNTGKPSELSLHRRDGSEVGGCSSV